METESSDPYTRWPEGEEGAADRKRKTVEEEEGRSSKGETKKAEGAKRKERTQIRRKEQPRKN